MSLSILILLLGILSWGFCLIVSARQMVRPERTLRIRQLSIPVWIWISGLLFSSSLITLVVLEKIGLLTWLPNGIVSSTYFFLLCLLTLYSFLTVLIIRFSPISNKLDTAKRIKLSVAAGFVTSVGLSSFFSSLWILQVKDANTDIGGLICILVPTQIIVSIGAYSQLKWRQKFEESARAYYEAHLPTNKDKIN